MESMREWLRPTEEVRAALAEGRAVLALESTIVTHGMPWPRNLETALDAERAARDAGAVPATVAVLDGALRVGLEEEELARLAKLGRDAVKCSRRDLAVALQRQWPGATTVSATLAIAAMAGIRVFATGGIGGVHRGAAESMDVSSDLHELARTPVAVVCAGPKAILDIGLTLEFLETHAVPVVGFRTDAMPAFYTRESGHPVDWRCDSAAEIADLLRAHWSLTTPGAVVIANPIPQSHALDAKVIEQHIEQAIREAEDRGIHGRALTPFLLERLEALTGGDSLDANVALMVNNARLGAEIAVALG